MLLEARKPQKHWVSAPSVSTFLLQSAKNHGRTELSTFCVKSPNICLGLATPECKAFCPPKFEGQKAWISLWKAIGQNGVVRQPTLLHRISTISRGSRWIGFLRCLGRRIL